MTFGVVIGVLIDNIGMGIGIGMSMGAGIGVALFAASTTIGDRTDRTDDTTPEHEPDE